VHGLNFLQKKVTPVDNHPNQINTNQDVERSKNSGAYHPGPVNDSDNPTSELDIVQANQKDILLEEFPDGPYGAATNAPKLGKSTPWKKGQVAISAYRDENPVMSDRKVPLDEPPSKAPKGSIEGQN
jgi:hypothetical protein